MLALTVWRATGEGGYELSVPEAGRVQMAGNDSTLRVACGLDGDVEGAFELRVYNGWSINRTDAELRYGGSELHRGLIGWIEEKFGRLEPTSWIDASLLRDARPAGVEGSAMPADWGEALIPARLVTLDDVVVATAPFVVESSVIPLPGTRPYVEGEPRVDYCRVSGDTLWIEAAWSDGYETEHFGVLLHRAEGSWEPAASHGYSVGCTLNFFRIPISGLRIFALESEGQLRLDLEFRTQRSASRILAMRLELPPESPSDAGRQYPGWGAETLISLWRELQEARAVVDGPR